MENLLRSPKALLLGVFVLSGFSGLVYQSIWSHYLGLFLGHAAYAQALVLAIFMGGMAAGAMWIAHVGERWRNLIRAYALIEALIGLLGLGFHLIFTAVAGFSYDVLIPSIGSPWATDVLRWTVAALLIVPQTVLLGMTFPLMSGGLTRRFPHHDGRLLGGLYFTNSIGAALGALVSVFVLLPWVGLPGAMVTAGVLNLLVAALAWWLSLGPELARATPAVPETRAQGTPAPGRPASQRLLWLVLCSTALSGAASFVYEIVWVRMLVMAVGSTLHAFELMLASFIAGIAFGGLWVRKRADAHPAPLRLVGWMQVCMGLAALASLALYGNAFEWVGWLMSALGKTEHGYSLYTLGTAAIAILIMLPAAFFAGTTLPLFTVALLRARQGERAIGQVYAWNTVGSIMGVFVAVHVLIPGLGLKLALVAAALVDMGIGLFLLRQQVQSRPALWRVAAAGFAVLLATALAVLRVPFEPERLASGVFRTGETSVPQGTHMLFYRDGKTASISVRGLPGGQLSIATNGKPDASITMTDASAPMSDEATMGLLATLPLAMHGDPQEVGVIGFGSGMTTHTLLGDARVRRVDTIEIEQVMVDGARAFGPRVARAYEDPRSHIVIDDAKAYFSGRQARYDIIVSEPSNPWVSGIGALFAKEFYAFVPRHLKPGGLFVQWVQLYEIDDALVASILNGLTATFTDYQAYLTNHADLIIVAAHDGKLPPVKAERVLQGMLGGEMRRLGLDAPEHLAFRQVADGRMLRAYGRLYGTRPNSYYHPLLSLEAPKTRFTNAVAWSLADLPYRPALLLEALSVRSPLPASTAPSRLNHFTADGATRRARAMARLLRGEAAEATAEAVAVPAAELAPAQLLHAVAQQVCHEPAAVWEEGLASRLREVTDLTMPLLPADVQRGVLIAPAWLPCAPERISPDLTRVLALLDALARREWAQASALGADWLTVPPGGATWKSHFDDVALSAVLLHKAREGDWQGLSEAEQSLGAKVESSGAYLATRMLLLAMADGEPRQGKMQEASQ
ncbi:fused MFS/spermidine synthase [Vandammella animalimorsus]|uniref:fused MFS/spermidine synthase n=1 Tax=Vandammella animalimorsus TaxID=2029117 RepID=UPI00325A8CFC